ncbi:MAG: hypothetical protein SVV67_09350 [Bacillota bacterium]|nr:hypothetical protein [Bacillota bacterium]
MPKTSRPFPGRGSSSARKLGRERLPPRASVVRKYPYTAASWPWPMRIQHYDLSPFYARCCSREDSLEELKLCSGVQFDPQLLSFLKKTLARVAAQEDEQKGLTPG